MNHTEIDAAVKELPITEADIAWLMMFFNASREDVIRTAKHLTGIMARRALVPPTPTTTTGDAGKE